MKKIKEKPGIWDRFLDWVHTEKTGDVQVIFGGEIVVLAIVIFYKFLDSAIGEVLKYEHYNLFVCVIIGICILFLAGLITLIYGIIKKIRKK